MKNGEKTREQLLNQVSRLRRRIAKLQASESECEHAKEALWESEVRFRALIENSLDGIAILNADGTTSYASPNAERILGYEKGELAGRHSLEVVHPDERQYVAETFARLVQNPGETRHEAVRVLHKDGSALVIEGIANNLVGDPVVNGIVINFRDITERKRAEQARIEQAAALAMAEELQRSRQRIVNAEETVRREIALQLHGSVQNRLVFFLHRLRELEHAASPGELAEELGDLREKLVELIEKHVRTISHRLYPSVLRRGLVVALQALGDQFETSLDVDMLLDEALKRQEKTDPEFVPEQVRLAAYRVAEEALTNAVKNANATKVTVGLNLSSEGWLCLTVRDNGLGFDVKSASDGLGLLMVQDYASVVGGSCIIHSAPGEGTEVRVTLPIAGPAAGYSERSSAFD